MTLPERFNGPSPVSWYPGHMLKAERQIKEKISQVDIVIEVVDARAPVTTRNFRFNEFLCNKPCILILNKTDLIPDQSLTKWLTFFRSDSISVLPLNKYAKHADKKLMQLLSEKAGELKYCASARILVIGVPNVGKSSLINYLIRKNKVMTGAKPGVTRNQQLIKLNDDFSLIDTPGVMTPKIDNLESAIKLSLIAGIKDNLINRILVIDYLLFKLCEPGRTKLEEYYGLADRPVDVEDFISILGTKRGQLLKGGIADTERTAIGVLKDYRDGKFGKNCLEHPE